MTRVSAARRGGGIELAVAYGSVKLALKLSDDEALQLLGELAEELRRGNGPAPAPFITQLLTRGRVSLLGGQHARSS